MSGFTIVTFPRHATHDHVSFTSGEGAPGATKSQALANLAKRLRATADEADALAAKYREMEMSSVRKMEGGAA